MLSMFFFRKILKSQIATSYLQECSSRLVFIALHSIALHHSYAMMNLSEERQAQQHQSYWCHHLLEEEIESPTIYTYPNLFSKSKEAEEEEAEEEVEEEEEDNDSTCRSQYTCFQCNVTISLISSSSSPLLLCPHCHAEFWEELEPLSPLPSTSTSSNPDLYSTPDINDVPEEDEDRYGNSSTVAVTKKKKSEKEWRRVIFHKIRTFFGFAF